MLLTIFKLGLQSTVAHNIAQNLNADSGFDITSYVENCWQLFVDAGIEDNIIQETFDVAIDQAKLEYAMGIVQNYGSAQMRPEVAYEYALSEYKRIFNK